MSPVFGRGCPAREPRDYRGRMCVFSVYYFILASLSSIREDTLERTRVRLESSRASTRKSYAVPDIPWGPATKGGGLGLDQLGRPRARRQASTSRGLAASPKGIAPQTREREELTMRRALRTTPLIP